MKVLKERHFEHSFPMKVTCRRVVDAYGFAYGKEADFCGSDLEVEESDIMKHSWEKYPDFSGVDYGVFCPVCHKFIPIDNKLLPASTKKNAPEKSVMM